MIDIDFGPVSRNSNDSHAGSRSTKLKREDVRYEAEPRRQLGRDGRRFRSIGRLDRQPEFTQIDVEMAFVDRDDILGMIDGLVSYVVKEVKNIDLPTLS